MEKKVIESLSNSKNKIPIFVGGTGLYLESFNDISAIPKIPLRLRNKNQKIA